jgi:DUF971 family protein
MTGTQPPLQVALAPQALTLHWSDTVASVPAALLRANCRCAPCLSARLRGAETAPAPALALVDAVPVGHYALQLRFNDGHERGIYPWALLRELGAGAAPPT